jgi:hypothetical protein
MRTQNDRILDRLLGSQRASLTSLEAAQMSPPIMRLSERIRELESRGAKFLRVTEKTAAGTGQYTRYVLISLENYNPRMSIMHPYSDAITDSQMAIL